MAIVTAPLLSFSATGTISNAITYSRRGGHDVVLKKPAHHTKASAKQSVQRGRFAKGTRFFFDRITNPTEYSGWKRVGTYKHGSETGHNACLSSVTRALVASSNASMAISATWTVGNELEWTMENLTSQDAGDEAGDFRIYVGDKPNAMTYLETKQIIGGKITTSDLGTEADYRYYVIVKDGVFRSGIFDVTE